MSLIHDAAEQGATDLIQDFIARALNVDERDESDRTALHVAAEAGQIGAAEALLKHGADIDARDAQGRTPLVRAVECEQREAVSFLLAHKADVTVRDRRGWTVLHTIARRGLTDIAEALLGSGRSIDVNVGDDEGRGPLYYAREGGHRAIADLLERKDACEYCAPARRRKHWADRWLQRLMRGITIRKGVRRR